MIILRIDLSFKQYNTTEHYNKDTDKTFYNFMVWSPHINKMDIPGDNPEQKTFHSSEPHTPTKQKKKKEQSLLQQSTLSTIEKTNMRVPVGQNTRKIQLHIPILPGQVQWYKEKA